MRYFKKQEVVEVSAKQLTAENGPEVANWCGGTLGVLASQRGPSATRDREPYSTQYVDVPLASGRVHRAVVGDFVVKGDPESLWGDFFWVLSEDAFRVYYQAEPGAEVGGAEYEALKKLDPHLLEALGSGLTPDQLRFHFFCLDAAEAGASD